MIYLIDTDPVHAKNRNTVHEGTAHYVTLNSIGYKALVNSKGTKAGVISRSGGQVANKSDFLS